GLVRANSNLLAASSLGLASSSSAAWDRRTVEAEGEERCAWCSCATRRRGCWGPTRRRGAAPSAAAWSWPRTWRAPGGSASSPSTSTPRGGSTAPSARAAWSLTLRRTPIVSSSLFSVSTLLIRACTTLLHAANNVQLLW
ncbi:unnamed protein product, partial [Musa acuminata var. zebrina]